MTNVRRTAVLLALTVVVAGLVLVIRARTDSPRAEPASREATELAPATTIPWWRDGVLHVAGTAIETPHRLLHHANGTTVVGRAHRRRGSAWSLVRGTSLVPLVRSERLVHLRLAADGRTAVWVEHVASDVRRVTAYDVGSGRELGSIDVEVETFCCTGNGELTVHGVAPDRRVIWSTGRAVAWRPGERATVPLRPAPSRLSLLGWPGGVMWQGTGEDVTASPGVLATVAADGTVTRVGQVPSDQLGAWSPDGSGFAYLGQADGRAQAKAVSDVAWVMDVPTGHRQRLDLPDDRDWHLLGWESADAVVLHVWAPFGQGADPGGLRAVLRCHPRTGECAEVADAPTGLVTLPTAAGS